jgi:hypothetical protein
MTRNTTTSIPATAPAKTNSRPLDSFIQTMKDTSVKENGRKLIITEILAPNLYGPIDSTPHAAMITQFKLCCAAGKLCNHKEVQVNIIHRCATCGFGVHAMCEVELKASKTKSVDSTSIKGGVCLACLTRLGFLEKAKRGDHQEEFLPMHHPNVFKNLAFDWAKLEISESNRRLFCLLNLCHRC